MKKDFKLNIKENKMNKKADNKEKLLETILNIMPNGLDIVDENLNILYMNKTFLDIFGKNAIGKKCYEIYKDNKKQCINCPLKSPIKLGETKTLISQGVAGGRVFQIIHTGMIYKGKKTILEIFNDITNIKNTEKELKKRNKELKIFNEFAVGRELKMINLKKEVNELFGRLGKESKYEIKKET